MIIILLVAILIALSLILIVEWIVHISMTTGECVPWGWGSIKNFKREFSKYNWDNENWGGHSAWDRKNNCTIHADIVIFNGIGMVMRTPIDYILMHLFLMNNIKKVQNKKKHVNWNKSTIQAVNFDWTKIDNMIAEWKAESKK